MSANMNFKASNCRKIPKEMDIAHNYKSTRVPINCWKIGHQKVYWLWVLNELYSFSWTMTFCIMCSFIILKLVPSLIVVLLTGVEFIMLLQGLNI